MYSFINICRFALHFFALLFIPLVPGGIDAYGFKSLGALDVEDLSIIIVQSKGATSATAYTLDGLLIWIIVTFVCACVLWIFRCVYRARSNNNWSTAFIDSLSVIVGSVSFESTHRAERVFILSLAIFALLFNILFINKLFTKYAIGGKSVKLRSIQDVAAANVTVFYINRLNFVNQRKYVVII